MWRTLLPVAVLLATPGCSFLFDTSEFRHDAGSVPVLGLDSVQPARVDEGATVPVVVTGANIAPGARVHALLDSQEVPVRAVLVNDAGTRLGVLLELPVLADLGTGELGRLELVVEQGQEQASVALELAGLDELIIDQDMFDTAALKERRFSSIEIRTEVRLVGQEPARFLATNAIRISASVHADGQDGQEL